MVDTVRIGGIKLSAELVQIDVVGDTCPNSTLINILKRIASAKINIPHLHQGAVGSKKQTTLCVAADDYLRLQAGLLGDLADCQSRLLKSVGTISLFPHSFSVEFCARVMSTLSAKAIPIYGISTSVSALVVHTDYTLLEDAVDAVLTFADLPENHTPLRPVVVLGGEEVETIAVYWEPQIRIYGMDITTGISRLQTACQVEGLDDKALNRLVTGRYSFRSLTAQAHVEDLFSLDFVVDQQKSAGLVRELQQITTSEYYSPLKITENVEMISFHGPHFQDRYGIAEMALSQLQLNNHQLLAAGCTGTSVQLLVSAGTAEQISSCLASKFIVPSREES